MLSDQICPKREKSDLRCYVVEIRESSHPCKELNNENSSYCVWETREGVEKVPNSFTIWSVLLVRRLPWKESSFTNSRTCYYDGEYYHD